MPAKPRQNQKGIAAWEAKNRHPHFTDKETEFQGSLVILLALHPAVNDGLEAGT